MSYQFIQLFENITVVVEGNITMSKKKLSTTKFPNFAPLPLFKSFVYGLFKVCLCVL